MVYYSIKPYKKRNSWLDWMANLNATNTIIIINVFCFLIFFLIESLSESLWGVSAYSFLALQANSLFDKGYIWSLLTSIFLHANIFHLVVNMLSLYFIGGFLEIIIGRKRFIGLYLISGVIAGLFFALLSYFFGVGIGVRIFASPETYAVGASGALFALAGLLAVLTPKNRVYLIVGPIVAFIIQAILQNFIKNIAILNLIDIFVMLYVFFSIFTMMSPNPKLRKFSLALEMPFWILPIVAIVPLVIVGLFVDLPIGNTAHLGGVLAGIAYGLYLRVKYKKKTRMISKYFSKH